MQTKNILMVVALLVLSVSALAGYVQPAPVTVNVNPDGSGSAQGDMISARNSDNDVEFIGCGVRTFDDGVGGVFSFGFCQATDENELNTLCNTQNTALLAGFNSVADSSFITFSWNDAQECIRIGTSTQSFYLQELKSEKSKKSKKSEKSSK